MEIFRLCHAGYADLSGVGGLYGAGRWHERGALACYLASTRSLAVLERMVHESLSDMPNLVMLTIWIPDDVSIERYSIDQLPKGWDTIPDAGISRPLGQEFFTRGESLLMQIPSAIVAEEYNFVLNPCHQDVAKIKVVESRDYFYDSRLEKMIR
ncbi:RES family NAD+ phosphorylase [Vibrio sp. TH_r3]|uniref:RES family NAD+ phosphorylase n=1 Tax=Vibrio sp. TH_r3 TaxID=3082084 RepID=UPI0029559887|nr:RES family NAD+ phosphorylase [Vibrio sp. TH_r3]MDV7105893.1 RES family NAD+ phosphorylase [Vibrio sp. TH_r3]